jgi:hypothetical protein
MCKFCENIAKDDEEFEKIRMNESEKDFIFVDKNALHVFVDTGDSFCNGILNNINYCPICGKDLRSECNGEN